MKPQKALHLHEELDKKKPKISGVYAIYTKYDGWYGYLDIGTPGAGYKNIHSRAGREIPSLIDLSSSINTRLCFDDMQIKGRLIFEIMIAGLEHDFSKLNGILNRSVEPCQALGAYIIVHDFVPYNELGFNTVCPFEQRREVAAKLVNELHLPQVSMAQPLWHSDDVDHWKDLAEEEWAKGNEGVILKKLDAGYSPDKRNSDLLKIKEEVTLDLLVVDVEEGNGKYKGTLGSIICRDRNHVRHHISGMTDDQRFNWWLSPMDILGQVVEIKAMKILPDGQLREPRFKAIRFDKLASEID